MKKVLSWTLVLLLCLGTVIPALAANVFLFTEKSVTLFEGESVETALKREGSYDGEGEVTYASAKESIATISEDGTITAVKKGETTVAAILTKNGKRAAKAVMTVRVLRAVSKVTLNTTRLNVFDPGDPAVAGLLREETEYQVLVIPAGSTASLSTTCTPETASSTKVSYTTTDAGVAKVAGNVLKAMQRGECDLTVASVQNPEVTETFRVLVIQPVKKIQVEAGSKKVAVGSTLQLTAACSPENASIQDVVWSSKNPSIATVDEDGMVTGVKKGTVTITATAADGSRAAGSVQVTVTQPVTGITFVKSEIEVLTGKTAQAKVTVSPEDASDKTLTWSSSDDEIATVKAGQITGRKAGICIVTCSSNSNPEIASEITVIVSQLVTKIECANPQDERSLKTGESLQLNWNVLPEDATNKELVFKSLQPRIATVDENGVVRAISRGTATIVATARDSGKKQGSVKITVIQPVTGVSLQHDLYYVQLGAKTTIRAIVEPKNANNQKVFWSCVDEDIATVRSNGTSTGSVYGWKQGETTLTAYTEDGGFIATTQIRVGDYNGLVLVEDLYVTENNTLRVLLRNMSQEITLQNIHFLIKCYDMNGEPMVCNTDGASPYAEGDYQYLLSPLTRTYHAGFRFKDFQPTGIIGAVEVTVVSWQDENGYNWIIPEADRVTKQYTRLNFSIEQGVG